MITELTFDLAKSPSSSFCRMTLVVPCKPEGVDQSSGCGRPGRDPNHAGLSVPSGGGGIFFENSVALYMAYLVNNLKKRLSHYLVNATSSQIREAQMLTIFSNACIPSHSLPVPYRGQSPRGESQYEWSMLAGRLH